MKYGLSDQTIDSIKGIFSRYPNIQKVILYGSRAKGNFKNGSDIDITLVAPELVFKDLLRIESEIDDLLLPHKVDLSIYHQIESKSLIEHIDRVGIPF